jgi:hypothetical protein
MCVIVISASLRNELCYDRHRSVSAVDRRLLLLRRPLSRVFIYSSAALVPQTADIEELLQRRVYTGLPPIGRIRMRRRTARQTRDAAACGATVRTPSEIPNEFVLYKKPTSGGQ